MTKILRVLLESLFLFVLCTQGVYLTLGSHDTHLEVVATLSFDDSAYARAYSVVVNEVTNQAYVGGFEGFYVVDCSTDKILDYVYLGPRFDSVHFIAVNPITNQVFVSGPKELGWGDVIYILNGNTYSVVGEIPLREGTFMMTQGGFAYNPNTDLIYISDASAYYGEPAYIRVYSASNFSLVTSIEVPGSSEHIYLESLWLAINSEAKLLYFIWTGSDTICLVDCESYAVLEEAACPENGPMIVNEATGHVYTAHSVLDGTSLEELAQLPGSIKAADPFDNLVVCGADTYVYIHEGVSHEMLETISLNHTLGRVVSVAVNTAMHKMYIVHDYGEVSVIEERSGPCNHIVINEFELNPSGSEPVMKEWVELYNPTSLDVNISGWILSQILLSGKKYYIPPDTVIEAGDFYVFTPDFPSDYWASMETVWIELRKSWNEVVDVAPQKSNVEDDDRSWQRSPDGCDHWVFEKSTLANPPVANANGPYSGDVDKTIQFNGSRSYDNDGVIISYEWDFGDGSTGVGRNPTHSYASVGTYEIALTVTDNVGASGLDTTTATIVEPTFTFPLLPTAFLVAGIVLFTSIVTIVLIRRRKGI